MSSFLKHNVAPRTYVGYTHDGPERWWTFPSAHENTLLGPSSLSVTSALSTLPATKISFVHWLCVVLVCLPKFSTQTTTHPGPREWVIHCFVSMLLLLLMQFDYGKWCQCGQDGASDFRDFEFHFSQTTSTAHCLTKNSQMGENSWRIQSHLLFSLSLHFYTAGSNTILKRNKIRTLLLLPSFHYFTAFTVQTFQSTNTTGKNTKSYVSAVFIWKHTKPHKVTKK